MPTHTKKASTTYRLAETTRARIKEIAGWYGISDTDVLEVAVGALHRQGPLVADAGVVAELVSECEPVPSGASGTPAPRGRPRKQVAPPAEAPPVDPPPEEPPASRKPRKRK